MEIGIVAAPGDHVSAFSPCGPARPGLLAEDRPTAARQAPASSTARLRG